MLNAGLTHLNRGNFSYCLNGYMKKDLFREIPWLSLILVCLTYILVGWHLSVFHPLWSLGTLIIAILIIAGLTWGGKPLGSLFRLGPRSVVTMMMLSAIITMAVAASALFALILILIFSKVLARIQLLCMGYRRTTILLLLSLITGLGLGLGWAIGQFLIPGSTFWLDFSFYPSSRFAGWLRSWG